MLSYFPHLTSFIITIFIFFTGIILIPVRAAGAEQSPVDSPQTPRPEQVIIIIIDGLGGKALENSLAPNITSLAQSGIRVQDVQAELPDRARPAVTTILTGLEPARHGYIDSGNQLRGDSLLDRAEARGYKTALFDGSGGALEALGKNCSYKYEENFQGKDRTVMDLAINELGNKKIYMSAVFLPQVKELLEQHGAESKAFLEAVAESDNQVGRLVHFLHQGGKYDNTLLVVTGTSGSPPLIIRGPGFKSGEILPAAGLVDIAPTIEKITGLQGGPGSGLILWDAFQPGGEQSESYLLSQRVNNLSRAYNQAIKEISRTQEEKIATEKGQSRMAADKNLILKEIGRRDQQIERMELKIRIMKVAGIVLLVAVLFGYFYQYRYLKKKFLIFN